MAHELDARPGGRRLRWAVGRPMAVAVTCAALLGSPAVPAQGSEPPRAGSAPAVGDFAVGDGLEALIDEESGSFGVTISVGGLDVRWDSRAATTGDRFGLGAGWGYPLGFVDTEGGARLVPPTSGEVFEVDASAPSGLRGYALEDLKFRRLGADAVPALPAAAFVLHELGGTSTFYREAGDPVATSSRHGDQATWEWSGKVPHRLERMVDADGVVTTLDWESEEGTLTIRPGVNLPVDADEPDRAWRVRFGASGAISAVTDPVGHRSEFEYQGGRLTRISNAAGAQTLIEWRSFDDGVPRVRRVSMSNPAGEQLSARTWDRFGAAIPSGWPMIGGDEGASARSSGSGFQTVLSDGVTSVRSEYSGERLLRSRDVLTDGAEGERMLQRQVFEYPQAGRGAGAAGALGTLRSRPIAATSTRFNASGDSRDERESFEYDVFGRVIERVDAIPGDDGEERRTTSTYSYDERERLVGSSVYDDQSRSETAYELSVAGDVTSETVTEQSDGATTVSLRDFEYAPGGELTASTTDGVRSEQAYDAAGNLARAVDGTTFTYNAVNRPLTETAPDGTIVTTDYWADGSRRSISATDGDGSSRRTEFVWDDARLIAETHRTDAESTTVAYLLGTDRHARTITGSNASSTSYYGTDRHGSVTELTTTDGDVTERYAYADYGTEITPGAVGTATSLETACTPVHVGDPRRNPFRYSGEYTDPTCRQNLAVRSYDSRTMRFTSMDTAAVMNPYAYTDANPITRVDPTGNDWERDGAATTLNRLALATGVAGLLGSIIAFTAPIHPVVAVLTLVASWADAVGVAAATVREVRPAWLTQSADDSLAMLDFSSGLAVVGIAAGAYAIWWRFITGRATQAAARRTLRMFTADPPSSSRPPGSGSSTNWNIGSGRRRAPSAEGDETTESLLAGQSSAEPMPIVDLMQNVDPSDVPDLSTLLMRKEGHLTRTKSGHYEFLYPELAVKPAARVVHPQPIPKPASKPVAGGEISSTPAGPSSSNTDVLDAVTTTSKRWPLAM